jgi:hypothetical protein
MVRRLFWSALPAALAGCATGTLAPLEATHPASPVAVEAPAARPSSVLVQPTSAPGQMTVVPADEGEAHQHGHAH